MPKVRVSWLSRRRLERTLSAGALLVLLPFVLSADTVTLPAVASFPLGTARSPFFSDVRVFNTSYTSSVSVTAVYRCFLGTCPSVAPQFLFPLDPRQSRAFDDMILSVFSAAATAGAVEFTSSGDSVRVTSRLYSPESAERLAAGVMGGTNGMFVPGVRSSEAHAVSVVTGLANGLFRSNVGAYNPNDVAVGVTFKLYNAGVLLGPASRTINPRSGAQFNIFQEVGQGAVVTTNAYAVVEAASASAPLFTYAAVIDNATSDSSFVAGDEDVPPPAGPLTLTINVRAWDFSPGGPNSPPIVLTVGQTYQFVFHNVDPPGTVSPRHGFSGISDLGLPGTDDISPGHDVTLPPFTPQPFQRGTHPFICTRNDCGGDPEQHRGMQGNIVIQ